jgi:hypothetical protein
VLRKPSGHSLYWVYAYWKDGYNFDTFTNLVEARKALRQFMIEDAKEAFIFYGDESGAFTNLDTVESCYGGRRC